MVRVLIFVGGIISFIIGCLIFLIGTGAILGCAGGLVSLFVGVLISMLGVGAIINFIVSRNDKHEINISEIVDLINRNGKWAFS